MTKTRSFAAAALAAAFLACGGGGDDPVVHPEEATVHGTLRQTQAFQVPGRVSFALQWLGAAFAESTVRADLDPYTPDPQLSIVCSVTSPIVYGTCDGVATSGGESCRVTDVLATALLQPVTYPAAFPISFAVPVEGAPPALTLYDLAGQGGSGVFAMGVLLAFVDSDGDGALRLGTPGSPGEPGLAISAYQDYLPPDGEPRRSYFVTYLRGTINPGNVFQPYAEVLLQLPQGYAVWLKEEWVDAYGRRVSVHRRAEPIETTPIELVSRPGIEDEAVWCRMYDVDMTYVAALPEGEVPLACSPDGLAAQWWRSTSFLPCTFREQRYEADFACATTTPPWSSLCPGG